MLFNSLHHSSSDGNSGSIKRAGSYGLAHDAAILGLALAAATGEAVWWQAELHPVIHKTALNAK